MAARDTGRMSARRCSLHRRGPSPFEPPRREGNFDALLQLSGPPGGAKCRALLERPSRPVSIVLEPASIGAVCAVYAWQIVPIVVR
jgi:hypothetical protein